MAGYGPMGQGNPGAMSDARSAYLKAELKIAPAQESAWKAYADQARQQAEAMQATFAAMRDSAPATAPERLDLRNRTAKQNLEQMEKVAGAFKNLYAVLTPEQKALADRRVGAIGGRRIAFNLQGE